MKISIITPSYNQGNFIEKTILSVLNQPYPNIEYIIIDGGSTDNTVDIIKKYEDKIHYWSSEKDRGQSHALNKGFAKATGDVVAWINSDDYYEENVFKEIMEMFENTKNAVVIGDCVVHYSKSSAIYKVVTGEVTLLSLLCYWKKYFCPPQPSIFFRKSVLDDVGYLNESLNYGMDLDLWIRMRMKYNFTYISKVYSYYLIHDSSKSGSEGGFSKFGAEWEKICRKYISQLSFADAVFFKGKYILHRIKFYFSYALNIIKNKIS